MRPSSYPLAERTDMTTEKNPLPLLSVRELTVHGPHVRPLLDAVPRDDGGLRQRRLRQSNAQQASRVSDANDEALAQTRRGRFRVKPHPFDARFRVGRDLA